MILFLPTCLFLRFYFPFFLLLLLLIGGSGSRSNGGRTTRNGTFDGDESGVTHRTTPTLHPPPSTSNAATNQAVVSGGAATSSFSTTPTTVHQMTSGHTASNPVAPGNGPAGVPPSRLAYTEKTMLLSSDDEFQWAVSTLPPIPHVHTPTHKTYIPPKHVLSKLYCFSLPPHCMCVSSRHYGDTRTLQTTHTHIRSYCNHIFYFPWAGTVVSIFCFSSFRIFVSPRVNVLHVNRIYYKYISFSVDCFIT